jgi:hypothetical protein
MGRNNEKEAGYTHDETVSTVPFFRRLDISGVCVRAWGLVGGLVGVWVPVSVLMCDGDGLQTETLTYTRATFPMRCGLGCTHTFNMVQIYHCMILPITWDHNRCQQIAIIIMNISGLLHTKTVDSTLISLL